MGGNRLLGRHRCIAVRHPLETIGVNGRPVVRLWGGNFNEPVKDPIMSVSMNTATVRCILSILSKRFRGINLTPYRHKVGAEGFEPPQRISSETAHQMGLQDCNRSALQLVINFSKPTRRHSRATGVRDTTKLYYTPLCIQPEASVLCLSAGTLSASQFFCATSNVDCRFSSKHVTLASW